MLKNKKFFFLICSLIFITKGFSIESIIDEQNEEKNFSKSKKIKNENTYLALGAGYFGFPSLELGYRSQVDHRAFNTSLQLATFLSFFEFIKADITFLHFPNPNSDSQIYYGAGFGGLVGSNLFNNYDNRTQGAVFPEFVLGYQYKNAYNKKRFIQGQLCYPTVFIDSKENLPFNIIFGLFLPQVSISYGWMF
ncbi:MAG: hypothetical protein WCT85_03085 [Parachlamydiales bacterium]|jgi:hypothetical protein